MHLFSDKLMAVLVNNAQQAASEPDECSRPLFVAALAANILARLATSELLKSDTRQQAAMMAGMH